MHNNKKFIKLFNQIALDKRRYDVFRDFITISAISLHNSCRKSQTLENEYLDIIKNYSREDLKSLTELLSEVVDLLDTKPQDILGTIFMELELGEAAKGQFFTPAPVSELMASVMEGENSDKPFITVLEPSCGAGGMILSLVNSMIQKDDIPFYKLWVRCIDVDRTSALMCYIQLSLWNVPAEVVVGNTLMLEFRESWHTPAHYLGHWDAKLKIREAEQYENESTTEKDMIDITINSV